MDARDTYDIALCDDVIYTILHWLYQSGDTITATMLLSTCANVSLRSRAKYLEQPAVFTVKIPSADHVINILTKCTGYTVTVDWGDNHWETTSEQLTHSYRTAGNYRIRLYNICGFNNMRAMNELVSFTTIGTVITDMSSMFCGAHAFNQRLFWNTSAVTAMGCMFYGAHAFNQQLIWNTSAVTNMSYMFYNAHVFNRSLHWNTSAVTNMSNMFYGANAFNRSLSSFEVKK